MNHDWVRCDYATKITRAGRGGSGEARLTAQVLLHHRGAIALFDVIRAHWWGLQRGAKGQDGAGPVDVDDRGDARGQTDADDHKRIRTRESRGSISGAESCASAKAVRCLNLASLPTHSDPQVRGDRRAALGQMRLIGRL